MLIFKVRKVRKGSNWDILLLFNNFLQNCSIFLFMSAATCIWGWVWSILKSWIWFDDRQGMFKVRNVSFVPFSDNSLYYLVVLKSCTKISMVLSHFQVRKFQFRPLWYIWANISSTLHALQFTSWKNLITLHSQNSIIHTYNLAYFSVGTCL